MNLLRNLSKLTKTCGILENITFLVNSYKPDLIFGSKIENLWAGSKNYSPINLLPARIVLEIQ